MKKLIRPLAAAGIAFLAATASGQAQDAPKIAATSAEFNEAACLKPATEGSFENVLDNITFAQMAGHELKADFVFVGKDQAARAATLEEFDAFNTDGIDSEKTRALLSAPLVYAMIEQGSEKAFIMASDKKGCAISEETFAAAKSRAVPLLSAPGIK